MKIKETDESYISEHRRQCDRVTQKIEIAEQFMGGLCKYGENYTILRYFTKKKTIDYSTDLKLYNSIETNADTQSNEEQIYEWDIVWLNVILLGTLHILAVYWLYIRFTSSHGSCLSVLIVKGLGIASSIGITAGAHRLWTHRCYKANKKLECLLMFMATMTYQNSIYIWARDHRLHHKCSETNEDPHNAKRGFFFSHVGWLLIRKHPEVIKQGKSIDLSDLEANPIVMFHHKYYYPLVLVCTFILPGVLICSVGLPLEESIFYTIYKYVVSVNLTWCINSVAHIFGHRPYDRNIGPTESQMMRYLGFGEGFHNYHHTYPWDYKAAEFGHDSRNLTTAFIDFFAWLEWASNLRVASSEVIERRCKRTGGPGREYHMMNGSPDKTAHNIASFILIALYVYIL